VTILPLDPSANLSPGALLGFLQQCREAARAVSGPRLVSISMEVDELDPLAVLESIFEPGELHFYVEKASEHLAIAGAEAVLSFASRGPGRFAECQRWVEATLSAALAVGPQSLPFAGPQFFYAFAFHDEVEPGEPFPAVQCFVPRWQVGSREGRTVATANLLVAPDTPVEALAERVWRAHGTFRAFDYGPDSIETQDTGDVLAAGEVGGTGHYQSAVAEALGRIGRGDFQKIVLARAQDLRAARPFHPLRALNGLRQRFPECYAFSVCNGRGQSFIGASPERLLRVQGGRMLTEALAGSARRGVSASEDAALGHALLRDEKELREHGHVLSSIARCLAPLGISVPTAAGRPALRRLANVQHLHTRIEADLPAGVTLMDLLSRLHPTPAVGGTPREPAIAAIRALEGFPRGLYAGALGWVDARGEGECFVGLRSALIDGGTTRLFAGAGIVSGSDPELEYQETELKIRAMRDALGCPTA
jgi:menaquinone-specific isochorismate synthase